MSSMEAKRKPQKPSNPETNSEEKTSSEATLSDSTSSDPKSVTFSSPSNATNSTYPSFSKLLQGVELAANSAHSSDSSFKSSGFQGQFAMSHQEALADVTAKAAQAHPPMQLQAESAKSLIKPSPKKKVEEHERMKRSSSFHTEEHSDDAPRTPKSDGYSWRKYGQKQVKSSGSSRSYYRCTNLSCCAKKKVQHLDVSGQVIDVAYKGDHNHDPPQILKGSSNRKKDSAPRTLKNLSDSSVQNFDDSYSPTCEKEPKQLLQLTHEGQDIYLKSAVVTPPTPKDEELHTKTVDNTSRLENELAIVPVEEHNVSRSDSSNELAMTDTMKEPEVVPLKKRRIKERVKACSESVYRTFKDPKIVVHEAGDVGTSDGYRWRKYGQKMVKGTPHPRSYYRCSSAGCPARKHVERATESSTAIIVTYEGKHDHDIPVPKKQHHHPQASPNHANAAASGASNSMLLDKSENNFVSQKNAEEQSHDMDRDLGEEKGLETAGDKVLESARTLLSIGIKLKSC